MLVVAGEASGDWHAFCLCREMQRQASKPIRVWGSGGEYLSGMGARLLASSHQLAAIGPAAALGQIRRYYRLYRSILREVERTRPRLAILVDFPDFNLPLARALRKRGVTPIVYFISPQLWAWRSGRISQIRQTVDKMIVLLPFEVDFYGSHGIKVDYFGHPLANRKFPEKDRQGFARRHHLDAGDILVSVLPGSRRREIEAILPLIFEGAAWLTAAEREKIQLVIAAAPGRRDQVESLAQLRPNREIKVRIIDGSDEVLAQCDYGLVKSGTSTLEAALAGLPFCVLYRVSPWSWLLGKLLVRTKHYALPNLILKERVVPELMQHQASPQNIAHMLSSFARRDPKWENVRRKLRQVKERLVADDPYGDAARAVLQLLGNNQ
jgi:lipid-A-disaccharide synthase